MKDRTEKAREFFKDDIYATEATGIVIEEATDNYARFSLVLDRRHKNANGQVMGGVLFTLADFAVAAALNDGEGTPFVSLSADIQFLRPAKGSVLTAETVVVKAGKTVCFMEAVITDNLGTKTAKLTGTWIKAG